MRTLSSQRRPFWYQDVRNRGVPLYDAHNRGVPLYDAYNRGVPLYDAHNRGVPLYDAHNRGVPLYDAHILTFLGRQKAALYCFYFHRKCPKRLERCIYIHNMLTAWRTLSRYKIFWRYSGKIHLFVPDSISKESFRPEKLFKVLV